MSEEQERVHRVTVRGRFRDLDERARQYLVRAQPEHDIFVSAYTPEGTFTYDDRIQFFNLRYEVRAASADDAAVTGEVEAEAFLRTMGFGHGDLKVDVVDVSAIWDGVQRDVVRRQGA
ncbi:MAG: DUF6204 family protein [Actinobacteria bacterium]|nr:DUF6204 family protein [Actinomycetota bacterium]